MQIGPKKPNLLGMMPRVPEKLQNHIRNLVQSGVARADAIYIKDGKEVRIELSVPLLYIGEEIAQALQDFSEGYIPKKPILSSPLRIKPKR